VGQDPEEGTPETTLHGWPDLAWFGTGVEVRMELF
jgi:hypothetical protein